MKMMLRGKEYSKNEYIGRVCTFYKNKGVYIKPSYIDDLGKEKLLSIYRYNIKKNSLIMITLPFIFFTSIGVISIICAFLLKDVFNDNSKIAIIFMGALFIMLGLSKLIRIIKKDKCYISYYYKAIKYNFISDKENNEILDLLKGE